MNYQIENWKNLVTPFTGVIDTLKALKEQNALIAIVTSRKRLTAELYSRELGLYEYFDIFCTPENTNKHKPDAEPAIWTMQQLNTTPEKSLFIGDAPFDINCGASAGTDTCYVKWGHTPVEKLDPQPTYVIDAFSDLIC